MKTKHIVLGVMAIIVIAALVGTLSGIFVPLSVRKDKLKVNAEEFCNDLNMEFKGATTDGLDSDGDGRVSVVAKCKDKDTDDASIERINLECSWSLFDFMPSGCKEPVNMGQQLRKQLKK